MLLPCAPIILSTDTCLINFFCIVLASPWAEIVCTLKPSFVLSELRVKTPH